MIEIFECIESQICIKLNQMFTASLDLWPKPYQDAALGYRTRLVSRVRYVTNPVAKLLDGILSLGLGIAIAR